MSEIVRIWLSACVVADKGWMVDAEPWDPSPGHAVILDVGSVSECTSEVVLLAQMLTEHAPAVHVTGGRLATRARLTIALLNDGSAERTGAADRRRRRLCDRAPLVTWAPGFVMSAADSDDDPDDAEDGMS